MGSPKPEGSVDRQITGRYCRQPAGLRGPGRDLHTTGRVVAAEVEIEARMLGSSLRVRSRRGRRAVGSTEERVTIGRRSPSGVTSGEASTEGRLAELYYAHAGPARRLAYLMTGDRHLAEDLVQEAFVKLAGRFQDLRNPDAFGAYLRKTVVNLSRGHFRRLRVERRHLAREKARAHVTEQQLPDVEARDELWTQLQRLPPRQKAAVVLRYYEDLSEQQTADALGCSVGAVKSLVNRAMEALRARVGERL